MRPSAALEARDFSRVRLHDLKHIIIDLPAEVTGVVLNPFGKALVLRRPQLMEIDGGMASCCQTRL